MKAIIWSKPTCPYCVMARNLLESKGYDVDYRAVGYGWNTEQLLEAVPNARTVPQIFIDGEHIGGYDNLQAHLKAKEQQ